MKNEWLKNLLGNVVEFAKFHWQDFLRNGFKDSYGGTYSHHKHTESDVGQFDFDFNNPLDH